MDFYCEQLVKIKRGFRHYLAAIGIWFATFVIAVLSILFLRVLAALIIMAAGYGAYYLCSFLSVEYEYIITNGTFDIDIIYAKRSRKRIASFELLNVQIIEKYNGEPIDKRKFNGVYIACNRNDKSAYKLVINRDPGTTVAVISPDDRTKQEIIKFVPKYVGNTAFK